LRQLCVTWMLTLSVLTWTQAGRVLNILIDLALGTGWGRSGLPPGRPDGTGRAAAPDRRAHAAKVAGLGREVGRPATGLDPPKGAAPGPPGGRRGPLRRERPRARPVRAGCRVTSLARPSRPRRPRPARRRASARPAPRSRATATGARRRGPRPEGNRSTTGARPGSRASGTRGRGRGGGAWRPRTATATGRSSRTRPGTRRRPARTGSGRRT
jgi:hypothetical protein